MLLLRESVVVCQLRDETDHQEPKDHLLFVDYESGQNGRLNSGSPGCPPCLQADFAAKSSKACSYALYLSRKNIIYGPKSLCRFNECVSSQKTRGLNVTTSCSRLNGLRLWLDARPIWSELSPPLPHFASTSCQCLIQSKTIPNCSFVSMYEG
jgi:hypothetical protein